MELKDLCRTAVRMGASDLHLKAGARPMIRVNGQMTPLEGAMAIPGERLGKMAWDLMTPAQRERFKANLELDLSWRLDDTGRFRLGASSGPALGWP